MSDRDMPRKSVVARVSTAHKISKVEAERMVRSVLEAVAAEIAERGRFHVAEIGSVSVARRRPRRYFNPRTNQDEVSQGDVSLKINISKAMRARLGKLDKAS